MVPATVPKSTSKVLYGTSKVPQRYFEGTPRYNESTVRYLVKVFESTSAYLSCTLKVDGNAMLQRPKRGETVHWSSKHHKSSGHSATTGS